MMESFGLGGACACDLTQLSSLVQKESSANAKPFFAASQKVRSTYLKERLLVDQS